MLSCVAQQKECALFDLPGRFLNIPASLPSYIARSIMQPYKSIYLPLTAIHYTPALIAQCWFMACSEQVQGCVAWRCCLLTATHKYLATSGACPQTPLVACLACRLPLPPPPPVHIAIVLFYCKQMHHLYVIVYGNITVWQCSVV